MFITYKVRKIVGKKSFFLMKIRFKGYFYLLLTFLED